MWNLFRLSSLIVWGTSDVVATSKQNPIRRVVGLLQEMATEIEAEVRKEKDAHEKFQCYCKKNDGELGKKSAEAAALIKKTKAEVEANTGLKKQLKEEIKKHTQERMQAQKDLTAATKKRTEEKTKYDEAVKEEKKTLEDIDAAVIALDKGMGKSFLQTDASMDLKRKLEDISAYSGLDKILDMEDQRTVLAFLNKDYHSQSSEIVGILRMMKDSIDESLGGVIQQEEVAVKAHLAVKQSLEDLIRTSGRAIEKKTELKGQTAVKIVEGKNLIATTEKQMGDDARTLMELKEACGAKSGEFSTRQDDAAAEVSAIHEAIAMLNNDDSLDLFNKTDTKALVQQQSSLLQFSSSKNKNALAKVITELSNVSTLKNSALSLLAFSAKQALKSTTGVDFSKVIKMIDDMVALLKQEYADDLKARDDCTYKLNVEATDKKETEHAIEGLSASIDELSAAIEQKAGQMEKAQNEIAGAKKAMAEATEQRKQDNADFVTAVDLNTQAVKLIQKAKNKLNSYYNPHLVPPPKAPELSPEEEIMEGAKTVFLQKSASEQRRIDFLEESALPKGQPETWEAGDRKNKGRKGSSVLALMDMLANDLNKDTQTLEHDEATAQSDYEKLSADLAQQVVESTTLFNDAKQSKAQAEDSKLTAESTLDMKNEEHADIVQTIKELHASCDFILQAFDERTAARENEISGLGKAKAILAGAKFEEPQP